MLYHALSDRPMPQSRRFPPPWTVEETDACFIVKDKNGQKLARRLTPDECRT
jgi:hypothetical protein